MQLTASDQDGTDLRQLTGSAGAAVSLDVDRQVLGFRRWCRQQIQGRALYARGQTERMFVVTPAG
jgi:hypothetical protein